MRSTLFCFLVASLQEVSSQADIGLNSPLASWDRGQISMQNDSDYGFSSTWEVLGPFQIGTREAAWGADPLELYGGFRSLDYDPQASFASSLPIDGLARWSTYTAEGISQDRDGVRLPLNLEFPDVQWEFLQTVYGWTALQYQGWARGTINVGGTSPQAFVLYTDSILEFWVDDEQYFGGDFYTFRKAPPVLRLEPGQHRIDVRLVRDVRALGGIGNPTIATTLQLNRTSGGLELATNGINLSDFVNGTFASPLAAVSVRNSGTSAVTVTDVVSNNSSIRVVFGGDEIQIAPGQTRSVRFTVTAEAADPEFVQVSLQYSSQGTNGTASVTAEQPVRSRSLYESHKVTFLHPGSIVSYTMLRPPLPNATCSTDSELPVHLFLHGAGNEADTDPVRTIYDPVNDTCAWALSPTGVTPWSADDWHNWGFADVEAAVASISDWIENVGWTGPKVDSSDWLVAGHSNGGQGTWYALTHRPDIVSAAAPVSGYLSIQTYVPYTLWRLTDPQKVAIVQAATNSYRHELLIGNAAGIPVHQQHGGADDNVPAYHSRSMFLLLREQGQSPNYTELPDSPHYFDGVMTTPSLQAFYREQLDDATNNSAEGGFILTVASPGDTQSKRGYRVLQLRDPGKLGRLYVSPAADSGEVALQTENILSFELPNLENGPLTVDGQSLTAQGDARVCVRSAQCSWQLRTEDEPRRRTGRQLGPLDAIMRSAGRFIIRYEDSLAARTALQVSRNLHQYYYADSDISSSFGSSIASGGNVFTLALGANIPATSIDDFPIRALDSGGISVTRADGTVEEYTPEDAVAAIFLRPLEDERLELVVWGANAEGLGIAARLVPLQTGVGQPDFVILSRESLWKGIDGVRALGFFDSDWQVTAGSYIS